MGVGEGRCGFEGACAVVLMLRDVRDAVPYICSLGRVVQRRCRVQPSQSSSMTAPPKGEPSLISSNSCQRTFLPLPSGEVAMPQGIDGEGRCCGTSGGRPLHPSSRWFIQRRCRVQPSQSSSMTAPPKGEPRLISIYARISRFLPLPSGEVAMPQGIDGEGRCSSSPTPIIQPKLKEGEPCGSPSFIHALIGISCR